MSETYLITAKTVEEAIAIANREYADQDHEVSYEILEMPKKGFLGIGAKEAKIKITVTKSVSAELDSLVSDIRGMKVMTSRGGEGKKQTQAQSPGKDLFHGFPPFSFFVRSAAGHIALPIIMGMD